MRTWNNRSDKKYKKNTNLKIYCQFIPFPQIFITNIFIMSQSH